MWACVFAAWGPRPIVANLHLGALFIALIALSPGLPAATSSSQAQSGRIWESERDGGRPLVVTLNKSFVALLNRIGVRSAKGHKWTQLRVRPIGSAS
jgi:hypothetical protein